MNASHRALYLLATATVLVALNPSAAAAQDGKTITSRNYEEIYERYLSSARKIQAPPGMWMADLTTDPKARRLNDLVTIAVVENLSATGSADSTVNKKSSGDVKIPASPVADWLGYIVPNSTDTKFSGAGGTTRTTQFTAKMTARVVEVLPNGDLVVEGVREVDINGDRNLVVLTGVVRAIDVGPGNVVSSARIGQLQIRSLSQGLIKDSLTPGWLIRILNKVF